jgi:hypothetical protein
LSATISIPHGCKPHRCCASDETRPHLQHGYLRKRGKNQWWVCASDSYTAVGIRAEVEEGEPVPGVIPLKALKLLDGKAKLVQVDDRTWKVDGTDGESTVYTVGDTVKDPTWLNFNKIGIWKKPTPAEVVEPFGFNPDLAANVGAALGGNGLRATLLTPLRGLHLAAIGHERERLGLLLPIRLTEPKR